MVLLKRSRRETAEILQGLCADAGSADVRIRCQDHLPSDDGLLAHRLVLAAASPVFLGHLLKGGAAPSDAHFELFQQFFGNLQIHTKKIRDVFWNYFLLSDSDGRCLHLPDFTAAQVRTVLSLIYLGQVSLAEDAAAPFEKLLDILQISVGLEAIGGRHDRRQRLPHVSGSSSSYRSLRHRNTNNVKVEQTEDCDPNLTLVRNQGGQEDELDGSLSTASAAPDTADDGDLCRLDLVELCFDANFVDGLDDELGSGQGTVEEPVVAAPPDQAQVEDDASAAGPVAVPEGAFPCHHCGKTFAKHQSMAAHVKSSHRRASPAKGDLGPVSTTASNGSTVTTQCPICSKVVLQSSLKAHLFYHRQSAASNHICQICSRTFTTGISLKRHLRIHQDSKPFCCDTCGKTFRQKGSLDSHSRVHTGVRLLCYSAENGGSGCGKSFITKSLLNQHLKASPKCRVAVVSLAASSSSSSSSTS